MTHAMKSSLALWVAVAVAAAAPFDDPIADPTAVVEFGRIRVTMLTASLVRIEKSDKSNNTHGHGGWDDRATLQARSPSNLFLS